MAGKGFLMLADVPWVMRQPLRNVRPTWSAVLVLLDIADVCFGGVAKRLLMTYMMASSASVGMECDERRKTSSLLISDRAGNRANLLPEGS